MINKALPLAICLGLLGADGALASDKHLDDGRGRKQPFNQAPSQQKVKKAYPDLAARENYLKMYPHFYDEAAAHNKDPLDWAGEQYVRWGRSENRLSFSEPLAPAPEGFDPAVYLRLYPEFLKQAEMFKMQPLIFAWVQYTVWGMNEKRVYLEGFNPRSYLEANPGLHQTLRRLNLTDAEEIRFAQVHYCQEGRSLNLPLNMKQREELNRLQQLRDAQARLIREEQVRQQQLLDEQARQQRLRDEQARAQQAEQARLQQIRDQEARAQKAREEDLRSYEETKRRLEEEKRQRQVEEDLQHLKGLLRELKDFDDARNAQYENNRRVVAKDSKEIIESERNRRFQVRFNQPSPANGTVIAWYLNPDIGNKLVNMLDSDTADAFSMVCKAFSNLADERPHLKLVRDITDDQFLQVVRTKGKLRTLDIGLCTKLMPEPIIRAAISCKGLQKMIVNDAHLLEVDLDAIRKACPDLELEVVKAPVGDQGGKGGAGSAAVAPVRDLEVLYEERARHILLRDHFLRLNNHIQRLAQLDMEDRRRNIIVCRQGIAELQAQLEEERRRFEVLVTEVRSGKIRELLGKYATNISADEIESLHRNIEFMRQERLNAINWDIDAQRTAERKYLEELNKLPAPAPARRYNFA